MAMWIIVTHCQGFNTTDKVYPRWLSSHSQKAYLVFFRVVHLAPTKKIVFQDLSDLFN